MKTKSWRAFTYPAVAAAMLVGLTGCGGGGGGGETSSYKGITSQAQITPGNATILAVGAWTTGDLGTNVDILGAVQTAQEIRPDSYSAVLMPFILEDAVNQLGIPAAVGQSYTGAVRQITLDPIYGSCGGVVTGTGSADDASGVFSASLSFQAYCEDGVTIDGPASLSGAIDLATFEPVKFTMTFNSLSLDDSLTLNNGTFSADYTISPMQISMDYVVLYNQKKKTYWFRDVQMQLLGGDAYVDITAMTGRYYDHDLGYVEISVEAPVRINDFANYPSSGTLILTGSGGTKARLTFMNDTEYLVEADTDGEGSYDYTDGPLTWSAGITLKDPLVISENGASDYFNVNNYYAVKAQIKTQSPDQSVYFSNDAMVVPLPYSSRFDMVSAPYFTYSRTLVPPSFAPPGTTWENMTYTFWVDNNGNGMRDGGEASRQCFVPPEAFRQMEIPVVFITGTDFPTIYWQTVAGATSYAVNFFEVLAGDVLGDLVFSVIIDGDGSSSYSYTYSGDLFSANPVLAVMVLAREDVTACYYNRSFYLTTHGM